MKDSSSYFNPVSDSTISNIMAYAKALSIRNSKHLGKIDFVLN